MAAGLAPGCVRAHCQARSGSDSGGRRGPGFALHLGPLRKLIAAVLLVLSAAWPLAANGDARADLETGRNLFSNGQYADAAKVFGQLLGEPLDAHSADYKKRREINQAARPVYAASLVALGRGAEADKVILDHLRDDPFYEPPPGQFPEPVVQHFITVLSDHRDEIELLKKRILKEREDSVLIEQQQQLLEQKRIAELERLAAEETVVTSRSRLIALAPFGVGQFQNGSNGLGAFFATAESLGAVSSLVSLVTAEHFASLSCRDPAVSCPDVKSAFRTARYVNWASFSVTAALMVAGIIEAEVSLVPESKTTRSRPIRAPMKVVPAATVTQEGAAVGLTVSF